MEALPSTSHGWSHLNISLIQPDYIMQSNKSAMQSHYAMVQPLHGKKITLQITQDLPTSHGETLEDIWIKPLHQNSKPTNQNESLKHLNKEDDILKNISQDLVSSCHKQDSSTMQQPDHSLQEDLTTTSDTKPLEPVQALLKNGKMPQEMLIRLLLNKQDSIAQIITQEIEEMENNQDNQDQTTDQHPDIHHQDLNEENSTWTLTSWPTQSIKWPWTITTEMYLHKNKRMKIMIVESLTMKTKMQSMKFMSEKAVQMENSRNFSDLSSTMFSQMSNKQLSRMATVSSARRRDISIDNVKSGQHTLDKNEREIFHIDRMLNPDQDRVIKAADLNKRAKGKIPMPWYTT